MLHVDDGIVLHQSRLRGDLEDRFKVILDGVQEFDTPASSGVGVEIPRDGDVTMSDSKQAEFRSGV